MRTFTKLLKTELKLNIRNMNMVIFAIIMPIAVLVVLGFIYQAKPAFIGSWLLAMVSTLSIGMMVGGIAKNEKMASVIASTLYLPRSCRGLCISWILCSRLPRESSL